MKNHTIIIENLYFLNISRIFILSELEENEISQFNKLIGIENALNVSPLFVPEICRLYAVVQLIELIENIKHHFSNAQKLDKMLEIFRILNTDHPDLLINILG